MSHKNILVVGAGLTGATLARMLADNGHRITVIDERSHVAGNCHTSRDSETGILVHRYGPHTFHTDCSRVWEFVNRFASFEPYTLRTKATVNGRVYSLPLNLLTINSVFEKAMRPDEARKFVASLADQSIVEPRNFEEQALAFLGERLYRTFFHGYTKKQWACEPRELPASILKRLPVRFNYDDNYFNHQYQGQPTNGYTALVENMLNHKNIEVRLKAAYAASMKDCHDHIFYGGSLDRYFNYQAGRLPYRSLDFEWFTDTGDYQGCAVMNYPEENVPWTRIIEHKHFTYREEHEATIVNREIPKECGENDIPYYPVRFIGDNRILDEYVKLAQQEDNVTFVGRLGTFRYLDMDAAIGEALAVADRFLETISPVA